MKYFSCFSLLLFCVHVSIANTITIGPYGDFPTLESANNAISIGDTVLILNGIYGDGTQFLYGLNGTEENPILIKAEEMHQVTFSGGTEAIHLIDCSWVIIDGMLITKQTGNGINIDDGGDYSSPTHHITIRNCVFVEMDASGNNDFIKLSGLDHFAVRNCSFTNGGTGGSGVDMVGCHNGIIEDCVFDNAGVTGIQAKGGTQYIDVRRNSFSNISQRAINIGGSTGLQYFRPPLTDPIENAFESANINVYANIFIGNWAPIAFVGTVDSKVFNNTIYNPGNWVFRVLQETTESGFLPCSNNEFFNNIIYLETDITEVNIGPNTDAESFVIDNNIWYNASDEDWQPILPVQGPNERILDPLFVDKVNYDFHLQEESIGIGNGRMLQLHTLDFDQDEFLDSPSIGAFEGGFASSTSDKIANVELSIFPNPTNGTIEVNRNTLGHSIILHDLCGQIKMKKTKATNNFIGNIEFLNNGMYVISIIDVDGNILKTVPIIKI